MAVLLDAALGLSTLIPSDIIPLMAQGILRDAAWS